MPDTFGLDPPWLRFVAEARVAVLTTLDPDGRPASVPICFVVLDGAIWSPLDEKPKRDPDPRGLRRVRNLLGDPRCALLVQRWDEDWSRLAFANLDVTGAVAEPGDPGHHRAVTALRTKYEQYEDHALGRRPMLRFTVARASTWGDPG